MNTVKIGRSIKRWKPVQVDGFNVGKVRQNAFGWEFQPNNEFVPWGNRFPAMTSKNLKALREQLTEDSNRM